MKCQEFQSIVTDVATSRLDDVSQRELAAAHARSCAACARRLASEHALSAALLSIAAGTRGHQASNRTEETLRAAFRQMASSQQDTSSSPVVVSHRRHQPWFGWALAAAAALTLAFGLSAWKLTGGTLPSHGPATLANLAEDDPGRRSPILGEILRPGSPRVDEAVPVGGPKKQHASVAVRGRQDRGRELAASGPGQTAVNENEEVTTEFFPLVASNALMQVDGGHVVRVQVPRTQVAALGLPVNFERADERITADIVLGNDGIARAIRFVQPRNGER